LQNFNNYIATIEIKRDNREQLPGQDDARIAGTDLQLEEGLGTEQPNQESPSLTLSQFLQREEFQSRAIENNEKENEPVFVPEPILEPSTKNTPVVEKPRENSQMKIEFVKHANIGLSKPVIKHGSIFESEKKIAYGRQEFPKSPSIVSEPTERDWSASRQKNDQQSETQTLNGSNKITDEVKFTTLSQYSIATPRPIDPENSQPAYVMQNLRSFLQETVKKSQENSVEKSSVITESNAKRNSYIIFDDRNELSTKNTSIRLLSHFADKRTEKESQQAAKFNRAELNALPNNSLQLRALMVSKEAEIKYLKEKLDLAKEAKSIHNQMMRTEDRSKLNQFKYDQLQVQIKSLAKENQEYQKQIDILKKKSQKDTEEYQNKLYFFQMEFESQTRYQMETKERDIVVEYVDREDSNLRTLLDRMIALEDTEKRIHK
jgi:hypothetical protein